MSRCLALGKQLHLQRRIRSPEAVSQSLLATGLQLARHRQLFEGTSESLEPARRAFAESLYDVLRRIDAIQALDAGRRAGMIEPD